MGVRGSGGEGWGRGRGGGAEGDGGVRWVLSGHWKSEGVMGG